ncbi:hypothetical protein GDO81_026564 [Engystomops pustulosus]|uniref:Uncharacterized protein n=1 Tax=Engystomops pustulosus TaxID=76066 RepID=A0AAV6YFL8_ENGPU|nr:hypothetical protein GDO81_026564 [Engystomops pustulosus]
MVPGVHQGKFNRLINRVEIRMEVKEFRFCACPEEEDVVYVPPPPQAMPKVGGAIDGVFLQDPDDNIGVSWRPLPRPSIANKSHLQTKNSYS